MATIKQKLALQKVTENHGNISKAMIEAGYTPETASKPKNLTESKGWAELMEQYLPDDKLLAKHEKALEATKWNDFTGERETDHATVLKAVDLGYKIKKHLGEGNTVNISGEKVLVIPSELIEKYGITPDSKDGS